MHHDRKSGGFIKDIDTHDEDKYSLQLGKLVKIRQQRATIRVLVGRSCDYTGLHTRMTIDFGQPKSRRL